MFVSIKKKIVWPPITTCGNERPSLLVKLLVREGKWKHYLFVCPVKARWFFLTKELVSGENDRKGRL